MKFPFTKEVVERVLKDQGYADVVIIKDSYVGRGHDKACIGFVTPEVRIFVQFLLELSGETEAEGVELEDLVAMAGTMCSDSFGKDCIVYFPKYDGFLVLVEAHACADGRCKVCLPVDEDDPEEYGARLNALRGMN